MIWHRLALAAAVAASLALAGCASMSPQECMVANWGEQGYKDGRNGYAPTRITEHRKACAEMGMLPDARRYRQGWDQGVLEYCTPPNGVSTGRAGQPYRNVCPAHLEGEFVYWHQLGMAVYDARHKTSDLESKIDRLHNQIRKEEDRGKRRDLQRELRHGEHDLNAARRDLARAERRLR